MNPVNNPSRPDQSPLSPWILRIQEPFRQDRRLTLGEKALRLHELYNQGYRVPDGIILSAEFFREFIHLSGLSEIMATIAAGEQNGEKDLRSRVSAIFKDYPWPYTLLSSIEERLSAIAGEAPCLWAVRSAVVGEDDEKASFAGQYSTVLNTTMEGIWPAVFYCFASFWSERAMVYRRQKGRMATFPLISVIIQKQLSPDYAGVFFTHHPSEPREVCLMEAVCGLAEDMVSGKVIPACWEITPATLEKKLINPDPEKKACLMPEGLIDELVKTSKRLEKEKGAPMDIEWAVEKNTLYLLQMRPVTTGFSPAVKEKQFAHVYSRTVVEDLWSDRMTPLTSSIIFDEFANLYTFKTPLKTLGLDEIAKIESIKVIHGFGYLHSLAVYKLLELIPPFVRFKEIMQVFPPHLMKEALGIPFNLRKVLRILPRIPLLFKDPAVIPFLTVFLLKRHLVRSESRLNQVSMEDYASFSPPELLSELERLLGLLSELQIRNQWGYGNASVMTWLARHFLCRYSADEGEIMSFFLDLPVNIALEMQEGLMALARLLHVIYPQNLPERVTLDALKDLPEACEFVGAFETYIRKFQCRSFNRDFIHPRWDEVPGEVFRLVLNFYDEKKLISKDENFSSPLLKAKKTLPFWLKPVIHLARQFLALREDLRFGLDKVFYRLRRLLLSLASHEVFTPYLLPDNWVFFLSLNEIRNLLKDPAEISVLQEKIQDRIEAYEKDRAFCPPYHIQDMGADIVDLSLPEGEKDTISGIAASPGVARGKACVITSSHEFGKLSRGDILIAYNTDPGWTPLFLTASAVVVEMGGILNHCAIVAREYGIPAVVGIRGICSRIKDGDIVYVDGNNGRISIQPCEKRL